MDINFHKKSGRMPVEWTLRKEAFQKAIDSFVLPADFKGMLLTRWCMGYDGCNNIFTYDINKVGNMDIVDIPLL